MGDLRAPADIPSIVLDIGLPVGQLRQGVRDVLSGALDHHEAVLPATNRRGRAVQCRVAVSPLRQTDKTVSGVILLMEEHAG